MISVARGGTVKRSRGTRLSLAVANITRHTAKLRLTVPPYRQCPRDIEATDCY